ncbi:MAG: DPP IV N-terminal domain-containing protein [Flavipsychrobacter sp.]|nr:DPP IV N-terminal domain-containing protein [Flavipsychrobacter sp.]
MRNIHKYILLSATLLTAQVHAQKKNFTIAEATNGMATTLATKGIKNASWQPGTARLWQTVKEGNTEVWKVTDYDRNTRSSFNISLTDGQPAGVNVSSMKWIDKDRAYVQKGGKIYVGTLSDKNWNWQLVTTLPENAENITVDKSLNIAYTVENNLFIRNRYSGQNTAISSEKDKNVICGKAVHRDEFGIDRGIFFSPKSTYVAYYRMDQTMVNNYPIIKWDATPAAANIIKYPMAGGKSHEVTLVVHNIASGSSATLQTGETNRDHYLTCVTWSPDEKSIYVAILNREQDHLWLNQYDAATGEKIKTLFEETHPKYVHPTHPLTFIEGRNNEFIWQSERDGFNHLYLYNTNGKLKRQLTSGKWVVNEIAGFNAAEGKLVITTSKESPMEKHMYSLSIDDGSMKRIDKEPGMHTAICNSDARYVLDIYSAAGIPKNTFVHATDGSGSYEIIKSENTLAAYNRPEIKDVTITAADGVTPLYGKLILPVNFDKNKKYPTIVYLYNGPNVQLLHNSFPESGNLWYEYMAQRGYVVFTMDGRGSWNRGLKFEQATFRHLGEVEIADQLQGVNYLKSLPYVDSKRMGVHGWSYGGFMTTSLMLKHPDVFKCGVAGGPVMDWKMYEIMYTERYMDLPANNPKGYDNANLLDKVKNLKGKLLLIHGTNDDVVVWQHSINFIRKCVDEGVQADYFVYPGHEHNVRGKDRVHLMQKITDYFDLYLK